MTKKIASAVLLLLLSSACTTTFDNKYVNDNKEPDNLTAFTLEAAFEPFDQRIDLAIAKKLIYFGSKTPKYSSIGVYMGNGFFLDTSGNLSIDLIRYFNIPKDATITRSGYNFFGGHNQALSIKQSEQLIEINSFLNHHMSIHIGNDTIKEEGNRFSRKYPGIVSIFNNELQYEVNKGLLTDVHKVVSIDQNTMVMESPDGTFGATRISDTEIDFNNNQQLINQGNNIVFSTTSNDSKKIHFTLVPTKKGFALFFQQRNVFHRGNTTPYLVERTGDTILVERNGMKMWRLDISRPES